jgi:hypothetical protein
LTGIQHFVALGIFGTIALGVAFLRNPGGIFDFAYTRSHATLDARGVSFVIKELDGSVAREHAPWSGYTCVRRTNDRWTNTFHRTNETRHTSYVASVIEIVHPNSDLTIPVFYADVRSRDGLGAGLTAGEAPRDLLEAWSRATGLPAVDGTVTRQADTLDLSLQQKVDRGLEHDLWSEDDPTPPGLHISRSIDNGNETFEIVMPRASGPDIMFFVILGFGMVLMLASVMLWIYVHQGAGIGLACAGLVFALFGFLPMLSDLYPRHLRINRRHIEIEPGRLFSSARPGRIDLADIEEVRLLGHGDQQRVSIISDDLEIHTGTLKPDAASWLRDFLIAAIARA